MASSGVIADYLASLSGQLPAPVVEELADGLEQTCQHYLNQGLDAHGAADAAVAEFGAPEVIFAAFTRLSSARHAARRLLASGPLVGACWAAALITSRAWTWPVPIMARLLFGLALIAVIGLLAVAALGTRHHSVSRAGAAGCAGITAIDLAMVILVPLTVPAMAWPLLLAMAASLARISFTARTLRTLRTS